MEISHADQLLIKKGIVLFELCSVNVDDIPIFAILMVDENDIARLKADSRKKPTINYNDYGRVALAGAGTPTDEDRVNAREIAMFLLRESA